MAIEKTFSIDAVINGEINVLDNCYFHRSALLITAEFGRPDLIKILLRRGADINRQDEWGNNALILATLHGNFKSVETLVKYGTNTDLNLKNSNGYTALDYSIMMDLDEITYFLIEHGADVNTTNNEGNTPLIMASNKGNVPVVKKLIQHLADPNSVNNAKDSALMYAIQGGHTEIINELISNGIDCNLQNVKKETALILVAKLRMSNTIKTLVTYPYLDINKEDDSKFNALMYASYYGDYDIVKDLLKYGADINHKNELGLSPLTCAAYGHHFEIYDLLITHGAERTINFSSSPHNGLEKLLFIIQINSSCSSKTFSGFTRIYRQLLLIIKSNEHITLTSALLELKKEDLQYLYPILSDKEYNAFSFLLIRLGIDVNSVYSGGMTPLMLAAEKSNELLVVKLIKLGANIAKINDGGDSALDIACRHGHLEIVKILCSHGASINYPDIGLKSKSIFKRSKSAFKDFKSPLLISINYGHITLTQWIINHLENINQATETGITALMYSATCKGKYSQTLLSICLESKVNVNIADSMGWTALMIAAQCNNIEFVKSLLLAHADVDLKCKDGRNAFTLAIQNNHKEAFSLMIEHTTDINQRIFENKTLLMYSAIFDCIEITKEILEHGGEINYCDDFGNTALLLATQLDNLKMVDFLLKNGACVNIQNKIGSTALMEAVMNQNVFIVNALLRARADLNLQNTVRKTALDFTSNLKFKSFMINYSNLIITDDYLAELSAEILPPPNSR